MFDCITIGDATLDRFLCFSETYTHTRNQACFTLGTKLPVTDLHEDIGGNACNVSFGLDALGCSTALYTSIGADYNGRRVLDRLKDSSIDRNFISIRQNERTNSATILSYTDDRIIFSYKTPSTYATHSLPDTRWIYLTSLGEGCEELIEHTRQFCTNCETKLAFNPGSYFMHHKLNMIRELLPSIDLLIVNREEAQKILDLDTHDIQILIAQLLEHGVSAIALTDGNNGAYVADQTITYFAPSLDVPVEEATGAGDAFSSGFLASFMQHSDLSQALRWGMFNAASAIQTIGATCGLLTYNDMQAQLSSSHLDVQEV